MDHGRLQLGPDGPIRDAQLLSAAAVAHIMGGPAALGVNPEFRNVASAAGNNVRFSPNIVAEEKRKKAEDAARALGQVETDVADAGFDAKVQFLRGTAAALMIAQAAERAWLLLSLDPLPWRMAGEGGDGLASLAAARAACARGTEAGGLLLLDVPLPEVSAAVSADAQRRTAAVSALSALAALIPKVSPSLRAALLYGLASCSRDDLACVFRARGGAEAMRAVLVSTAESGLSNADSAPQACRVLANLAGLGHPLAALPAGLVSSRLKRVLLLPMAVGGSSIGRDEAEAMDTDGEGGGGETGRTLAGAKQAAWMGAKLLSALLWQARARRLTRLTLAADAGASRPERDCQLRLSPGLPPLHAGCCRRASRARERGVGAFVGGPRH